VHVGSKFCGTKSLSQNPQVLRKICVFLPSWDRGLAPQNLDTTCTYPASLLGIRFWNSFLEGPDEGLVRRKRQSWQKIHNCASYTFRKEVSAQLLFPYKLYLSLVTAIFLHENESSFFTAQQWYSDGWDYGWTFGHGITQIFCVLCEVIDSGIVSSFSSRGIGFL
jgi:hypothetical protein